MDVPTGIFYTTPLIAENHGRFHFEVWQHLHPNVEHFFVSAQHRRQTQAIVSQLSFHDPAEYKRFMRWWETYRKKFPENMGLYPEPRPETSYRAVQLTETDKPDEIWKWVCVECVGHVSYLSGASGEYGITGAMFVLFENENDRVKYLLSKKG